MANPSIIRSGGVGGSTDLNIRRTVAEIIFLNTHSIIWFGPVRNGTGNLYGNPPIASLNLKCSLKYELPTANLAGKSNANISISEPGVTVTLSPARPNAISEVHT